MLIDDLLQGLLERKEDAEILGLINMLISRKKESTEKSTMKRSALLEDYLENLLATMGEILPENSPKADIERLNTVFRTIIE